MRPEHWRPHHFLNALNIVLACIAGIIAYQHESYVICACMVGVILLISLNTRR